MQLVAASGMLSGCFFFLQGVRKVVKVDGKMDAANYRAVLEENLLQAAGGYFGKGSPSSRSV